MSAERLRFATPCDLLSPTVPAHCTISAADHSRRWPIRLQATPEAHTGAPRQIAKAAGIMAAAAVASRLLGVVREATVAALFGAGDAKAAYVVAYSVPFFVQRLLMGGTLSIVFIPTITRYLTRGDPAETDRVVNNLLTFVLLVGLAMVAAGQAVAPWVIPVAAPGFAAAPRLLELATELTRILFVAMFFLGVSLFLTGYLQSHQQFTVPALAPLLFNLVIIGASVVLAPLWDIRGLAVAWVLGTAAQCLVQVPAALRAGLRYRPRLELRHPALREVVRLALPAMMGLAVVEVNSYVDRVFASYLPGGTVNAVAVLDYAYEVVQAPVGFFAISIATAIFPHLSRHAGTGDLESLRRTASLGLRAAVFATAPVLALYVSVPDLLVRVLFERYAFGPEATDAVAGAVAAYGVGLVSVACYTVVTRVFYALHDMATPVRVGAAMIVLNAVLDWLFMRWWGHMGIALATSAVSTVNVATLLWLARGRLGSLEGRRVGRSVARAMAAAALCGLAAWAAAQGAGGWVDPQRLRGQLVQLAFALAAGGAAYLVASALTRIEELRVVVGLFRRGAASSRA
ncbi:MAG: murein biosynthesis integral membrane protein MurJ [Armatimonadota bacterium]|nr:murein biosynthesis integral membrane protein MurJ [Armatimonadota bacterium]